jgi:hypothetical protein
MIGHPVPSAATSEPVLRRLRAELGRLYGDRLERVLLVRLARAGDGPAGLGLGTWPS